VQASLYFEIQYGHCPKLAGRLIKWENDRGAPICQACRTVDLMEKIGPIIIYLYGYIYAGESGSPVCPDKLQ
jgi:hypothetical protein